MSERKLTSEVETGQEIVQDHITNQKQIKGKRRKTLVRWLIISGVVLLILVFGLVQYFSSSASNLANITIKGNSVLTDEYIKKVTGLNYNTKFIAVFGSWRSYQAKKDPLITKVDIETTSFHGVTITVTENTILGYRYDSDDMEMILADGNVVPFDSEVIKSLDVFPMFINFSDDKVKTYAPLLAAVDPEVRCRIAEISDYSLSWDNDMIKCVMDDGYKVFLSKGAVPLLNQYIKIIVSSTSPYRCLYLDDVQSVGVMRDCADFESQSTDEKETDSTVNEEVSDAVNN